LDVKQVQESVRSRERGSLECVTLHTHLRLNPFDIAEAAPCRGARISGGHAVLLVLPDAHLQMDRSRPEFPFRHETVAEGVDDHTALEH
jgi:hypothetical protein